MAGDGKHVIALFQGVARNGEPGYNLDRMMEQTRKASAVGAELIIFPEMFLTGYELGDEEVKRVAEEKDGRSFQELPAAAKKAGTAVVYRYPEVDHSSGETRYFNSTQLIDKDGKSLMNYPAKLICGCMAVLKQSSLLEMNSLSLIRVGWKSVYWFAMMLSFLSRFEL